jgi:membrane protein CcdC involved in cytochrome C biogenesis
VNRVRNLVADILVGLVLLVVAIWVLRRIFGTVVWLANTLAFVAILITLLIVASRLRSK